MRETKKNKTSINVGIPTYEAGDSLVATLDSLYKQTSFKLVKKVIVVVDGNTISENIKAKINNPKLQIIYGLKRQGQPSRINDIFKSANTDLVILTNDDVILDKYALKNIVQTFIKTRADLISGAVTPLPAKTFLEKVLFVGYQINLKIYRNWNKGDNYLSCNGRLLTLSKRLYKKIKVPKKLWNNDAFLYLFVKVNHFKYAHQGKAIAWYQMPTQISEHIKQSSKFKQSYKENRKYFTSDISSYYAIPPVSFIRYIFNSFLSKPLITILYLIVSIITILSLIPLNSASGYWETDTSTKKLNLIV